MSNKCKKGKRQLCHKYKPHIFCTTSLYFSSNVHFHSQTDIYMYTHTFVYTDTKYLGTREAVTPVQLEC